MRRGLRKRGLSSDVTASIDAWGNAAVSADTVAETKAKSTKTALVVGAGALGLLALSVA